MKFRHIGPSRTKSIFKFASPKMGRMFKLESSLEYYTCFHLEYSSDVKAYIAQPGPIEYLLNGEPENFFPDFWVDSTKMSTYLLEIKHSSKISNPDLRYKFQLRRNAPALNSLPLVLITERQICQNPILNNLKLMHHYAGVDSITPVHKWILNFVALNGQNRIQNLIEESNYSAADIISASVNLIANGKLKADIYETELGKSSLVWCSI